MFPSPYFSDIYFKRSEETLKQAVESVPLYREWKSLLKPNGRSIDQLYRDLPVLNKRAIREHFPGGLVPEGKDLQEGLDTGAVAYVNTSGTTEEVVTNIWNQEWWNASEAASWKLNRHTMHLDHSVKEAQLASALSVGFLSEDTDLDMQARMLGRFLFLNEKGNANHWKVEHYQRMMHELEDFRPAVLEANPSLLARLSWWASRNDRKNTELPVVLFTYELLATMQLRQIEKAFPVPLASSYGSTETGYVFMQCEHGTFHQNTDYCRVDFEPLPEKHGGPGIGRIFVTTFQNPWTSMIRFDVGDLVRLHETGICPCGRKEGLMLAAIEGRVANLSYKPGGGMVTTHFVDEQLSGIDDLLDYQLWQPSLNEIQVKLLSLEESKETMKEAIALLKGIYGPGVAVSAEFCRAIEPSASGKFFRTWSALKPKPEELFLL